MPEGDSVVVELLQRLQEGEKSFFRFGHAAYMTDDGAEAWRELGGDDDILARAVVTPDESNRNLNIKAKEELNVIFETPLHLSYQIFSWYSIISQWTKQNK